MQTADGACPAVHSPTKLSQLINDRNITIQVKSGWRPCQNCNKYHFTNI